jgi:beta-lactamase superfamily II metal-dependent hydrolase
MGSRVSQVDNSGATRENTLAIVDVGHGSAAVAVADGRVVIIDAGPKVGLLEYLSDQNIKEVDLLLLSHADQDHISGLICLLGARTINISRIRLNSDSRKDSEVWGDLLYELADNAKVGRTNVSFSITTGQTKEFSDERLGIEVLAPSIQLAGKGPGGQTRDGKKITAHMVSAVIRILRGGKPIAVLFGDLDQAGLHELVAEKLDATASLLVFPHHGGGAGTTDLSDFAKQLCELVQPQIVAFSIGRGRYRTPQPSVVKTIKDWNKDVRIACTQLSEYCAAEIKMADTAHLHPAFALGRERGHCCAGTLVFNLDNVNAVTPSGEAHKSFIRKSAPTALCS